MLAATRRCPREYGFMPLDDLRRERPTTSAERVLARGRLRERRAGSARPGAPRARAARRSTSTTTTTTRASATINLIVADASSTGEVLAGRASRELGVELTPEIAEPLYIALVTDTGRFQYTNTTPKALRLAAELVEAGADVQRVFQQVYESVEFAKLKLLARALDRAQVSRAGGSSSRTCCATTSRRSALPSRTRRGSSTTCARSRARARRADPRAAARRRPDAPRLACARASTSSTSRRSRARSAAAGTARRPASRARRRSTRSPSSSAGIRRAACPRERLSPRASRSSTSRRGRRRSRSSRRSAG